MKTVHVQLADSIRRLVLESTAAQHVARTTEVQSLWSGYGQILRVDLKGGPVSSVIVKHVAPPRASAHPRGWNSDQSHSRKLKSYAVEANWYANYSSRCDVSGDREAVMQDGMSCRVPHCFSTLQENGEFLFVLEDLDAAGYSLRRSRLNHQGVLLGLDWLANFHARFLGVAPVGLWEVGTYWHLATRPDELAAMMPCDLKDAATLIDMQLNKCRYQTLIHGDAKVANFCFTAEPTKIAAVDFQYVGGGCGMKDVAYFLGSCLDETECEQHAEVFLDHYFAEFRSAVARRAPMSPIDTIEHEWRTLYPFAWADFTRFMLGWCPGHTKLNAYSRRISDEVIKQLRS